VLLLAVGIMLGALLLYPSSTEVSFFGYEVPVLCGFRRLTGQECPGCGLTRSFSFMAHGHLRAAFNTHMLGPLAFALLAVQIPLRAWRLWRPVADHEVTTPAGRRHAPDQ